ncbi:MAG: polysaccharide biosynthesis tyrosine autokinase [Isosphaeraceae bacterium]
MDTTDGSNLNLPARLPASVLVPAAAREIEVAPAASSVNPRQILRGLVRNWWRILLIWVVTSAPIVLLIYKLGQPTYQAESNLWIESNEPELFGPTTTTNESLVSQPVYLETEATTIKTNSVIKAALAKPGITKLPMLRLSEDPKAVIQENLEVTIIPHTHWVRVALASIDAKEATDIVNAVVNSYKEQNEERGSGAKRIFLGELEKKLDEYKKKIEDTRTKLQKAGASGNVAFSKPSLKSSDQPDQSPQPNFDTLTLDTYKTTKDHLMQTKLQLMEYEARLQAMEAETQQAEANGGKATDPSKEDSPELWAEIRHEFKRDPEVMDLVDDILSAQDTLKHTKTLARRPDEPARLAAEERLKRLNAQYNNLWEVKSEEIRQRLLVPTAGRGPEFDSVADLKRKIKEEKVKEARLQALIKQNQETVQKSNEETVKATFLRDDLDTLNREYELINRKVETLKFTRDKPRVSIEDIQPAEEPKFPHNNKRIKYMLIAPTAILLALLGLFLLLEIRAERVADPDLLSSRVHSEVFALPPLPSAGSQRKLNAPGVHDQIDRFIQRLDHLRFAVCGDTSHTEIGRCVLVTSAVGGEGKTTLAAQLAARCGNAGISTLLIDADMRRAALCPLLDIPEGPGLSDLLKGEAQLEQVLLPVQGGSFHLLAAGTPVADTSRLFQGRAFAMQIAELRQRYEMIIIDSPPVLPMPDALMLGRWTDGVLLAARFEISRAPQVERARRQLDNAGIPVLGTVINCMRSSDSYYGRYSYSRTRDSQRDAETADTVEGAETARTPDNT